MDLVFDLLNDRSPYDGSKGLFSYRDAQVVEVSLVKVDTYVKDLRNVSESNHIAIPTIELTFIQVCSYYQINLLNRN